MIVNYSRIQTFRNCRRKYFEVWENGYVSHELNLDTETGTVVHDVVPEYLKTKDLAAAEFKIEKHFNELKEKAFVPEILPSIDAQMRLALETLKVYASSWVSEFELVVPEYEGTFDLLDGKHQICFRTDGVILMNRQLWLLERKTLSPKVSLDGGNGRSSGYLGLWHLEQQAATYLLGVSKCLKINPIGFYLEIIRKTTYPEIVREPYLRTTRQQEQLEKELYSVVEDMDQCEQRVKAGVPPDIVYYKEPSMSSCQAFFRDCTFMNMCKEEQLYQIGEAFDTRKEDYVDRARKGASALPNETPS